MIDLRQRLRSYFEGPERNALLAALLCALLMVALGTVLMGQLESFLVGQQRSRLEAQLTGYDNALVTSLGRRLVLLQGLRAWTEGELATHGQINRAEFESVARSMFDTSTGNHSIWLAPAGIQTYVYPANEPGAGIDLLHTQPPELAMDATAAINTHDVVVSLPDLTPAGPELRGRLAIYYQSHYWGLVTITIDLSAVFGDSGLPAASNRVQLALVDSADKVIYGDALVLQNEPVVEAVNFPGGSWRLVAAPVDGWTGSVAVALNLMRVFGLVAVLLICGLVYQGMGRQARLALAVRTRTRQLDQELAERKRIEQEVRESEEKYRTLVETSPDAVLLQTLYGKIVDCNMAACHMFDYPRQSLVKMQMADLLPEEVASLLPNRITPELTTGGAFVETFYRRGDNHLFSAEVSSQIIAVGPETFVIAYIRDITERKQAEDALRDSEERYRSLVETSPDAIALTDLRGRIQICNQKAATLFDYETPEQLMGVNVFELIAPDDRQRAQETGRKLFHGAPNRDTDYTAITRKGRRFPCELSASTIYDKAGRPKGFTGVLRDVSDRKQQAREQAAIIVAASALRTSVTLDEISQNILNQLLGLLNSEGAAIFIAVPATNEAVCVRGVSRWQNWTGIHQGQGEGMTSRVISTGQPFVNNDVKNYPQTSRLEVMGGLNAVAGAPLISQERTIGALWVGRTAPFREGELRVLMVIADMVANAVQRAVLFDDLQKSNRDLEQAYDRTLEGWSRALELRDRETEGHTRRAAEYTVDLGRTLGMSAEDLLHARRGALLHDIGKLGIPDDILLKPGPLSEEEWKTMRKHPDYARQLIEPIPYLARALDIPYCHHEHWDGSGYPRGLQGEQIPLAARIFCVVDVWDAITSDRVYRSAWSFEKARQYMLDNAGVLFDPKVVDIFFHIGGQQDRLDPGEEI